MLISKHSPRRSCESKPVLSLETKKGTFYSLRKLSTDSELQVYGGMRGSPTVYKEWVSSPARKPNILMREKTNHWEYIGTYVDDLAITSKDPQAIVDKLVKDYKFTFKGMGPISYHLGCDFMRDEDKVLCIQPRKYIEQMVETYIRLFGETPKELYSSPLEKGDHPPTCLTPTEYRSTSQ